MVLFIIEIIVNLHNLLYIIYGQMENSWRGVKVIEEVT